MKNCLTVLCFILLISCHEQEGPDVSGIQVNLKTVRFEKDMFAVDTNDLRVSMDILTRKHPDFLRDYAINILGISGSDEEAMRLFKKFVHDYRPLYDSTIRIFPDLSKEYNELVKALKYVKYYFPSYPLPEKLITFIGPIDGYGDVITEAGLAVGLQVHMGANFSMYHSEMGMALYPAYISRRFTREYIAVNCIRNIVDDLFPDHSSEKTLIEQMVEKGKRMYVIDKLMPHTPDSIKTGYTARQLNGCYSNEGLIWNYFVKNGLVFNNDPSLIKNYIGESPNTPEFGEGAPGNIGLFVGWQIVKKYMSENPELSLTDLMQTDPKLLFEKSGYRPK